MTRCPGYGTDQGCGTDQNGQKSFDEFRILRPRDVHLSNHLNFVPIDPSSSPGLKKKLQITFIPRFLLFGIIISSIAI